MGHSLETTKKGKPKPSLFKNKLNSVNEITITPTKTRSLSVILIIKKRVVLIYVYYNSGCRLYLFRVLRLFVQQIS